MKEKHSHFTIDNYDGSIPNMLDAMQLCYNQILHQGRTKEDYILKVEGLKELKIKRRSIIVTLPYLYQS